MDLSLIVANDVERLRIEEAARKAPEAWRFKRLKAREVKMLVAVLATLGTVLVVVGQWLAAKGMPNVTSSA